MGGWGVAPSILVLLKSENQLFRRWNLNTGWGGKDLMNSGNQCFVGMCGEEALLCSPAFL